MTSPILYRCDNCERLYRSESEFKQEIRDYFERVEPGGMVPAGECPDPECGALVYPVQRPVERPFLPVGGATVRDLCEELAEWTGLSERAQRRIFEVQQELMRRMEEEGAEAMPVEGYEVGRKRAAPTYNRETIASQLATFRDQGRIPADVFDRAITLPHRRPLPVPITHEDVPLSVDMTKVKALTKYGDAVREVIEENTAPGPYRLVFKIKAACTQKAPIIT